MVVTERYRMISPSLKSDLFFSLSLWLGSVCFGLAIPVSLYFILPEMGIRFFDSLFSLTNFLFAIVLLIGAIIYLGYLRCIHAKPHWLVYFIVVAWPVLEYGNHFLLVKLGINLHLRLLLILILGIPIGRMGFEHIGMLLKRLPYLKYYMAFWILLLFYFLLNNSQATDTRFGLASAWSEGSVGVIQFMAYSHCLLSIIAVAVSLFRHSNPKKLFDNVNKSLLIVSSMLSLITIFCYPLGILSMQLDGFQRAFGIFTHPNPFAHHMGILLLYFSGLCFYYQGENRGRVSVWLLTGGILINLVAFLLGLSKTAIALFAMSAFVLLLFNISSAALRQAASRVLLVLAFLMPLGLWLFQVATGQSLFEILSARIEQTNSFNWRLEIWGSLIANMDALSLLIGHGFTAANAWILQLTFNNRFNTQPLMMAHNGYIALLYDFGIWGLLMFASAGSLLLHSLRGMLSACCQTANRPLLATVLALSIYFLIACGFDEMTYMFDAPILFWALSTLLYSLALRGIAK